VPKLAREFPPASFPSSSSTFRDHPRGPQDVISPSLDARHGLQTEFHV
jgi:hypothetical protein